MQRVSEHAYVESAYLGCNVGVVLTAEGPVIIDTPALPKDADDLKAKLAAMTDRPVARVVYTHEHFDHVIGAAYLTRRGVVGQRVCVKEIEYLQHNLGAEISHFFPDLYRMYQPVFDSVELIPPQTTFLRRMALRVGGLTLELSRTGGHSPASILAYLEEERVLFGGDIVDAGMPFVTPYSRFDEWITALRRIEGMEVDVIVPGHGEVCGKSPVTATLAYFEAMRDRVQRLVSGGASKAQTVEGADLKDALPVPYSDELLPQVMSAAGMMYDEVTRGR